MNQNLIWLPEMTNVILEACFPEAEKCARWAAKGTKATCRKPAGNVDF